MVTVLPVTVPPLAGVTATATPGTATTTARTKAFIVEPSSGSRLLSPKTTSPKLLNEGTWDTRAYDFRLPTAVTAGLASGPAALRTRGFPLDCPCTGREK